MWKIGNVTINGYVVLGPMAGITSLSYREFMKPFGVGLSYTEMVSDCGLDYGNIKTMDYIKTSTLDHPVGIQLFGSDINRTLKAIEILENSNQKYDILDINLGCPVPKVTRTGAGSAWLKKPKELYDYMSQICKHSSHPVTAKIRLGWDDKSINYLEIIDILTKAGVKAITIHARTTAQLYSGKANYSILKDLGKQMSIPLIVSGDIYTLQDAINAMNITGATAVMVARGGVGNPVLIKQINQYYESNLLLPSPTLAEQCNYLKQYAQMLINEKGEISAIKILRGIAPKFLLNFKGMKPYKNEMAQSIKTYDDLLNIINNVCK
jgi:tRNA-dihydrouridine synthase B